MKRCLTCIAAVGILSALFIAPVTAITVDPVPTDTSNTGTILQIEEYGDAGYTGWLEFKVTVVDDVTGAPVVGAILKLVSERGQEAGIGPAITGSNGSYATDSNGVLVFRIYPSPEKYTLTIDANGEYQAYESDLFEVTGNSRTTVRLLKAPPPVGSIYYNVYYYAEKGGTLPIEHERVRAGYYPTKAPVPVLDEGSEFVGWTLDGAFIIPEKHQIRRETKFYAIFKELLPTPTPTVSPTPTASPVPTVSPSPAVSPSPPFVDIDIGGNQGNGGNSGNGGNQGGGTVNPTAPPDTMEPTEPATPDTSPEVPPAVTPGVDETPCHVHWLILVCILITLVLTAWRLFVVRKQLRELADDGQKEGVLTAHE